ncbi:MULTISPECIES: hypothetical protein [unclassified Bradyrhizobium]
MTKPDWMSLWHVWTIIIPRRTISSELAWGRVWRRFDGRSWIYKRFAELEAELALLWQIVDFAAFYRIPESIFQ